MATMMVGMLLLLAGLAITFLTPLFWVGLVVAAFGAGRLTHRHQLLSPTPAYRRPAHEIDLSVRRAERERERRLWW